MTHPTVHRARIAMRPSECKRNAGRGRSPAGPHVRLAPGRLSTMLDGLSRVMDAALHAQILSRVPPGSHPPGAPTDPDVRDSPIRLLRSGVRCATGTPVVHPVCYPWESR